MTSAPERLLPSIAGALAYDLGASMHAIATAANIGRTTLHRHFPTRQDLTQAVAEYALLECDRIFLGTGIDPQPTQTGSADDPAGVAASAANPEEEAGAATAAAPPLVPAREALDRLATEVLPLAVVFGLLWADPPITSQVQVEPEVETRDARFDAFARRGQNEGCFRSDVPSKWIVHSIGSQAIAVGWAVRLGDVGAREAERLFRVTVVDGLGRSSTRP